MTKRRYSAAGVIFRFLTVASKFLLVAYLARHLSLEDLGIYGLVVATSTFAIYLFGFEFNLFSMRELVRREPAERPVIVWSQLRFHAVVYPLAVPLLMLYFWLGPLSFSHAIWIAPILLGTHATIELHRLLITVGRPGTAYAMAAIAHGLWTLPVILIGTLKPDLLDLNLVFGCWSVFAWVAAIIGWRSIKSLGLLSGGPSLGDWSIVKQGLRVSWIYFLVAVFDQGIAIADRYILQAFSGDAQVGVYTFYSRPAAVLQDFVYSGVTAVVLPLLLASHQSEDKLARREQLKRLTKGTLGLTLLLVPLLIGGMLVILELVDRQALRSEFGVFYLLLLANAVQNLAVIPHYILYCRNADRAILAITMIGLVVNLVTNFVLIPSFGIEGAAWALVITAFVQGALRLGFASWGNGL